MKLGDQVICIKKNDCYYNKKGKIMDIEFDYPFPYFIEFENNKSVSYKKNEIVSINSLKLKNLIKKDS